MSQADFIKVRELINNLTMDEMYELKDFLDTTILGLQEEIDEMNVPDND